MAKLTNYKVSETETGIKRYEGAEFVVVINDNDNEHGVTVWQRGYPESLYCGPDANEASNATTLDTFEWFELMNSEPFNVELI